MNANNDINYIISKIKSTRRTCWFVSFPGKKLLGDDTGKSIVNLGNKILDKN